MSPRLICLLLVASLTAGLSTTRPVPRPPLAGDGSLPLVIEAVPVSLTVPDGARVRLLSAHVLRSGDPTFGGLSGLLIEDGGRAGIAVSDRGRWFRLRLRRAGGVIVGVEAAQTASMLGRRGRPLRRGARDAEGIAILGEGLAVSFEGIHRVRRYGRDGRRAALLPDPPGLDRLSPNSGIEGLAAAGDGSLLAIPERSGALERPFPVWRLGPGASAWEQGAWPRRPPHLVTGADVGADDFLYVLERDFSFLVGWSARLSRAAMGDWPDFRPETLLEWTRGGIDNMEAVAVWQDSDGLTRIVLLSDDNFHPLQRTLLLEFVLS